MTGQGLDISIFNMALDRGDISQRMALARELAGLVTHGLATREEREAVQPVLARLAADPSRALRAELAQMLAGTLELSDRVAFTIIADEPEISRPFLLQAQCLKGDRLLKALQLSDEARQMVLAARADLSPEAVKLMANNSSAACVLVLLGNAQAKPDAQDYKAICNRLASDGAVAEALLAHDDLPAVVRASLSAEAALRLAQGFAEHPLLPANRTRDVLLEARENALAQLALGTVEDEWMELASHLTQRDEMTASLFVRLAALGAMGFAQKALCHLGGTSQKASSQKLVRAAGLPEIAGLIVREALELFRDGEAPGDGFSHHLIERLALGPAAEAIKAEALAMLGEAAGESARQVAIALAQRLGWQGQAEIAA